MADNCDTVGWAGTRMFPYCGLGPILVMNTQDVPALRSGLVLVVVIIMLVLIMAGLFMNSEIFVILLIAL